METLDFKEAVTLFLDRTMSDLKNESEIPALNIVFPDSAFKLFEYIKEHPYETEGSYVPPLYDRDIEKAKIENNSNKDLPTINIHNPVLFFELLTDIINSWRDFKNKCFGSYSPRALFIQNIKRLFLRMSPSDFDNIEQFLQRELSFLKDETFEEYISKNTVIGEYEGYILKTALEEAPSWCETSKKMTFYLTNDNNEFHTLPSIYFGITEEYGENTKLAALMSGKYYLGIDNKKDVDFYVIKGVAEEILDYLGYNGRYSFVMPKQMPSQMHPGQTADISVNNDIIGMVGKLYPLVEKEDGVFLKVIPYGGIIPQSWLDIPLILVGRIYTDEKAITINTKDEFEFTITSLLPHLDGRKEMEKFSINSLMVRIGNNKKENVLEFLKEKYGIHEDDFELADLSFVPASPVRELGFDKDLISGYGHDDSSCAFASLIALMESTNDTKTQIAIFASYEETGSNQATGCNSEFIDDIFLDLADGDFVVARQGIRNSMIISADVCAAFESRYASHFEDSAKAVLGKGVAIVPYLGRKRGNDTDFHFRALVKQLALDNEIKYQIETTKATEGGGGTVSTFFTTKGSYVIDVGVPVLAMHSPQEVISKTDLHETYKLYKVFFELKN